ncbi:MAG: orotidine 5'-phosphate decarboxylase / HUMPS family protein [bacterium]
MEIKHNFVQLAEVQLAQKTLYCAGLDPHPFGPEKNAEIYSKFGDIETQLYYEHLTGMLPGIEKEEARKMSVVLSGVEGYLRNNINIFLDKCNIRVFKPQYAFYEQFGPAGDFLLARLRYHIRKHEREKGRIICCLDCKRGDIETTQAAYFLGLMGNLLEQWGIDYAPYDFDIINVSPWMGKDVMALQDKKKNPLLGLKLLQQGKGLIGVNKTSNPSGPDYQELHTVERGLTLQMCHVADSYAWSNEFDLEHDGLSSLGLVVGSTHPCDGSIRAAFPTTTLLVPGFRAQGGKFNYVMLELIKSGKWNGLGAMFSLSRASNYPHFENYGGSGKIENLETDLMKSVQIFREKEEEAYNLPEVADAGIVYPFNNVSTVQA